MSAAQAAQEMDSRASTAPSQAGQAGHVAQTYRVPGWRGHHKLYLAALSLGGVCVWLFVWLVVFEKALPVNVVGFAAVIFEVTLKTGVFAVLFVRYVAGEGAVVAPADPGGKVGRAPSLRKWAHEAFELDAADARKRGGVDAELHVRRIRMRLACLEVWALLAVPLAGVYAVDPGRCAWFPERRIVEQESCGCCGYALGDSLPETLWADCGFDENYCSMALSPEQCTPNDDCESACATKVKKAGWYRARSPGFDRVSLTNVMCVEGNTATWQLWLAVLALYLGHWAAYKIIDAHDEAASDTIRKAAEDAPPHHYAVAATGLPENLRQPAALEAFFEGVFASPGAVVRVVPCRHLSAAAARDDVEGGAPSQPDEPPLAQLSAAHIRARHAATAADGAEHQLQRLRASGVSTRTVAAAAAEHESLKDVAARALHEITDLFGGDGGARGRVRAFCEALKEVERAEWRQALYERWEGEEKQKIQRSCATCIDGCICCCSFVEHRLADQTASPADARRRCEAARKAVADHDTDEAPGGGSAIVVFSSLESAQAAAICPLGAPDVATEVLKPTFRRDKLHRAGERGRLIVALETAGYYLTGLQGCVSKSKPVPMEVTPLPEPRDVDWGELETLDAEVGEKSDRKNAGRLIKLGVWFGYSAIVAVFAVNWEALCEKLADEDHALLWELLAGFVPAYFQDWLFDYVAVILRATNRMFSSLWSESALQASVARDYSIFFWIVAFGAYLLSVTWAEISDEAWVCEGECDTAADPGLPADDYDINTERFDPGIAIKLMARAVPRHAWPFAALFLLQIGDMGADALRVVPYFRHKLLKRAKVASDASVAEALEPDGADLGTSAGWEAFALLVGACFACISPFTCAVCYLYFAAAYESGKHTLCCLETMPFDTRGSLWFDGVAQTHTALCIALFVQLAVVWFNSSDAGVWPALGGAPLVLVWKRYRDISRRRHATRNLHGLARGRMPLRDANAVDARRDREVVRDALEHLADVDKFFEAPEVLPPPSHPVYANALPGPPIDNDTDVAARLDAVEAWLGRHDGAAAAFLERVNGTEIVSLGGDVIVDSDDIACGTLGCGGL